MTVEIDIQSNSRRARADLDRLQRSIGRIETASIRSSRTITNLGRAATIAFASLPLLLVGRRALQTAATFQVLEARLITTLGTLARANTAFRDINRIVQATPFSVRALTDAFARFANAGLSDIPRRLQEVADATAAIGGTDVQFTSIAIAFERIASEGRVTAERLNTIADNGLPLTRIAEAAGRTVQELRAMSMAGQLTSRVFFDAFRRFAQDDVAGAASRQVNTLNGAVSNLNDALDIFFRQALNQSGASAIIVRAIQSITRGVISASDGIETTIAGVILSFRIFFVDLGEIFEDVGILIDGLDFDIPSFDIPDLPDLTLPDLDVASFTTSFTDIQKLVTTGAEALRGTDFSISITSSDLTKPIDDVVKSLSNFKTDTTTPLMDIKSFSETVIDYFFDIYDQVVANSWWRETIDYVKSTSTSLKTDVTPGFNAFSTFVIGVFKDIYDRFTMEYSNFEVYLALDETGKSQLDRDLAAIGMRLNETFGETLIKVGVDEASVTQANGDIRPFSELVAALRQEVRIRFRQSGLVEITEDLNTRFGNVLIKLGIDPSGIQTAEGDVRPFRELISNLAQEARIKVIVARVEIPIVAAKLSSDIKSVIAMVEMSSGFITVKTRVDELIFNVSRTDSVKEINRLISEISTANDLDDIQLTTKTTAQDIADSVNRGIATAQKSVKALLLGVNFADPISEVDSFSSIAQSQVDKNPLTFSSGITLAVTAISDFTKSIITAIGKTKLGMAIGTAIGPISLSFAQDVDDVKEVGVAIADSTTDGLNDIKPASIQGFIGVITAALVLVFTFKKGSLLSKALVGSITLALDDSILTALTSDSTKQSFELAGFTIGTGLVNFLQTDGSILGAILDLGIRLGQGLLRAVVGTSGVDARIETNTQVDSFSGASAQISIIQSALEGLTTSSAAGALSIAIFGVSTALIFKFFTSPLKTIIFIYKTFIRFVGTPLKGAAGRVFGSLGLILFGRGGPAAITKGINGIQTQVNGIGGGTTTTAAAGGAAAATAATTAANRRAGANALTGQAVTGGGRIASIIASFLVFDAVLVDKDPTLLSFAKAIVASVVTAIVIEATFVKIGTLLGNLLFPPGQPATVLTKAKSLGATVLKGIRAGLGLVTTITPVIAPIIAPVAAIAATTSLLGGVDENSSSIAIDAANATGRGQVGTVGEFNNLRNRDVRGDQSFTAPDGDVLSQGLEDALNNVVGSIDSLVNNPGAQFVVSDDVDLPEPTVERISLILAGRISEIIGKLTPSDIENIPAFQNGGQINGAGTGRSDSILARVSNGEFVVNSASTSQFLPLLEQINNGQLPAFRDGGFVGNIRSLSTAALSDGPTNVDGLIGRILGETDIEALSANLTRLTPELNDIRGRVISTPDELVGVVRELQGITGANSISGVKDYFAASLAAQAVGSVLNGEESLFGYISRFFDSIDLPLPTLPDNLAETAGFLADTVNFTSGAFGYLGDHAVATSRPTITALERYITGLSPMDQQDTVDNALFEGLTQAPRGAAIGGVLGGTAAALKLAGSFTAGIFGAASALYTGGAGSLGIAGGALLSGAKGIGLSLLTGGVWGTALAAALGALAGGVFTGAGGALDFLLNEERSGPTLIGADSLSGIGAVGNVIRRQNGGVIRGPGTGRSDSITARLSNGEFVVNAAATSRFLPLLEQINGGGTLPAFQLGGLAGQLRSLGIDVDDNDVDGLDARAFELLTRQVGLLNTATERNNRVRERNSSEDEFGRRRIGEGNAGLMRSIDTLTRQINSSVGARGADGQRIGPTINPLDDPNATLNLTGIREQLAMEVGLTLSNGFRMGFRSLFNGEGLDFTSFADSILMNLANSFADSAARQLELLAFGGEGIEGFINDLFTSTPTVAAATGGSISGPGTGTSDSIIARLSNGEFVVNARQAARFRPLLEQINGGNLNGFQAGGSVGSSSGSTGMRGNTYNINISGNVDQRAIEQIRGVINNSQREVANANGAFSSNSRGLTQRRF